MFQTPNAKKSAIIRRIDLRATMKMMARGTYVEIPGWDLTRQAILMAVKAFNAEAGREEYAWSRSRASNGKNYYVIERR